MGRHTKTTGYAHHHTKYTKHHTYEKSNKNFESIVIGYGWVGFSFWFPSRALYIHFYLHTYMTKKLEKRLCISDFENAIGEIKSAQYHAKGYEYHFSIQIVTEAVVIVIICRQNFASTNSVMLWLFYVIMKTNKFRVMCVWWLHVMKWGFFYSSLRIAHAFSLSKFTKMSNQMKFYTNQTRVNYRLLHGDSIFFMKFE